MAKKGGRTPGSKKGAPRYKNGKLKSHKAAFTPRKKKRG